MSFAPEPGLVFGHIEGIDVGDTFDSRAELREAGIHLPPMAGIWGREKDGACSIVLSGGYEDDVDYLDYILYTGQGGQNNPGMGRPLVTHQKFTRGNRGLQLSCDYDLSVRVTRGYQIKNGPQTGYRYDGLYRVTSYERIIGKSGFYICRFHLESELSVVSLEQKLRGSLPDDYEIVKRTEVKLSKLRRKIELAEKIKEIYNYRCQVCGVYLEKPGGAIAIGAHIKPLGQPHNGPDVLNNMLCLCPNHHDQFDSFSFYIDPTSLEVQGIKEYAGKRITVLKRHKLDPTFLEYHKSLYEISVVGNS